jgi:hypothetical protein
LHALDAEHYRRFNRTIIERTITQASYFSQIDLEHGVLTMISKGIEHFIAHVHSFLVVANKIVQSKDEELSEHGVNILRFRLTGAGEITAAIKYFMAVCNDLIALTQKHFIQGHVAKIEKDEDKIKYLLRSKATLLQQKPIR